MVDFKIEIPVREHVEKMKVYLTALEGRLVIQAFNEAGYNSTCIDLLDLITWLAEDQGLIADKQKELYG